MYPTKFEGAVEIKKPADMTDEQCMSLWAKHGFGKLMQIIQSWDLSKLSVPPMVAGTDQDNFNYYLTAWKPSYEDLQALNRGEPIYVKTLSAGLPPMALFTIDENGEGNF
jgi:hypothetical protein